jgi:hypothetical protein
MALGRLFPETLKLPWIAVAVISGFPPGTFKRTDFSVELARYRPDCIRSALARLHIHLSAGS